MVWNRARLPGAFGFAVHHKISWIFVAALITWSLAEGFFPSYYKGASSSTYWIMGCAGTMGFLFSILLHEIGHLIAARRFGLRVNGITLSVFGGVTEIGGDPPHATAEFFIAAAGPLASAVTGIMWYAAAYLAEMAGSQALPAVAVLRYLGIINFVLVSFNLIPAFPLDGGRILRATLWQWKNNLRWATELAAKTGTTFGIALMAWGIITILSGSPLSGIWWLLCGQFLRNAAHVSYQAVAIRFYFQGAQVGRFMMAHPVSLSSSTTIEQLVKLYFRKYRFKFFPIEGSNAVRCVAVRAVKTVPRREWPYHTVADFAIPCTRRCTIGIGDDIWKAYTIMSRSGNPSLIVLDRDGNFAGIVILRDLMRFLALKLYLDGGRAPGGGALL